MTIAIADLWRLSGRLRYPPVGNHWFLGRLQVWRSRFIALVRAAINGVRPLLPLEFLAAPFERSRVATSILLQLTERRRGVSPKLSSASISAPQSSKASATSTLPRRAAMCSAVQCFTPSLASTFARLEREREPHFHLPKLCTHLPNNRAGAAADPAPHGHKMPTIVCGMCLCRPWPDIGRSHAQLSVQQGWEAF